VLINFTIYCNGNMRHRHEDVDVHTLIFAPHEDGSFEWTTPVDGLRVDDEPLWPNPPSDWLDQATGDQARWLRVYACPRAECPLSVRARDENFRPVVARLLGHGVSRLSLAGLARTLGHS